MKDSRSWILGFQFRVRDRAWAPAVRLMSVLFGLAFSLGTTARAAEGASVSPNRVSVILVIGAAGEAQFGREFGVQENAWREAAQRADARLVVVGSGAPGEGGLTDRDRLQQALSSEEKTGPVELWLVLVGHGTFDGERGKFNLRGPDVSAAELSQWLKPFQRPLAIVDAASASAPFLAALSGPNRAIVTATRSGFEQNYTRFGGYFAAALTNGKSDLDKDGQVSLLEAFLTAARQTAEFYKTEGRLATEHPLLDDNGDGLGTPADWFRGTRATKRAKDGAGLDGARARQLTLVRSAAEQVLSPELRARRDALELQVEKLRAEKTKLPDNEYYDRLEKLMLELASVYGGT